MPPQVIDKPDRARQLARAIVSDIGLYNQAKVQEGMAKDSLWDTLKDEIEEGRQLFASRVTTEMRGMSFYEKALVDVLLKSQGHVKSPVW